MKSIYLLPLAGLLAIFAACSDPVAQPKSAPHIFRPYDPRIPGVQITHIYYDYETNKEAEGRLNQWVIVQTNTPVPTRDWVLFSADNHTFKSFPDTIYNRYIIYTRTETGVPSPSAGTYELERGWIWNARHDTATLYNDRGKIISVLRY